MRRRRGALAVALSALNKLMQRSTASGPRSDANRSVVSRDDQVALAKSVLGIVRDYLAARTGVSTAQKTSAELQAAFGGDSQSSGQALAEFEGLIYSNDAIDDEKLGALVNAVKADLERLDKRL
jgi:ubiquinone biosynthesis protein UbiJ